MYNSLIVPLLVLRLAASLSAADADSMALVPRQEEKTEAGYHRLYKRQSVCIYFFLVEPPRSLLCNPEVNGTLILGCNFLVGNVENGMSLSIGWFFSRDGVVGERQQVSQFQVLQRFVAFGSVLVVQNALPGAYFCSVSINGQNLVFDSRALRVNSTTLQDVCLPQEPPTLQPPFPFRCPQRLPINQNDLRVSATTMTTNTINLGSTQNPTPTYTITVVEQFERTIPPPVVIATPVLQTEPPPVITVVEQFERTIPPPVVIATPVLQTEPPPVASNSVGIGIGVGVGVALLLALLVAALIVGAVWFHRKRNSLHTTKRRCTLMDRFRTLQVGPNAEPLIGRPPDRPPPVLLQEPPRPDPRGEHIEMVQYTAPQVPLPYEKVVSSMPRYAKEPVKAHPSTSVPHSVTEHGVLTQATPSIEQEAPQYADIQDEDHTYSRPTFFKKERGFSTSTHAYGECGRSHSTSSSTYITPTQLEPFFSQQITEEQLMLTSIEESTGYTSSDFLPSDTEDGSYSGEAAYEEADSQASTERRLDEPDSWLGKSPATGQIGNSEEPSYVNARQNTLHLIEEGHRASYVNTPAEVADPNATQISIKSAPNARTKKKHKKVKRNKSTPSHGQRDDDTYTGLVHETSNYTSVYASTLLPESRGQQN